MDRQSEISVERIPWIPIILFTIVFCFLGPAITSMTPNPTWYGLGSLACNLTLLVTPLLLIMSVAIVGRIVGRTISAVTYTYLYATGTAVWVAASTAGYPLGINFINIVYDRIGLSPEINPWPPFLTAPANVITPMAMGGAAVPWAAWIPAFAWWWLLFASLAVFALGQGLIWRKRWMDVEKVPFPQARVAIELVEKATSSERSLKTCLGLPFLVGLVLGAAFQLPLLLAYLFPWFPDIYGWKTNTCTMGAQYITTDSPFAGIVGFAQFNKDPALGAVFYMAPLNILFGVWFWYLIFAILMQVAFTMGYYTGITGEAGCGRVWCGSVGYRVGDPFKWDAFSSAGVTTGIFISYVVLNWRYVAETFNAAIGKLSKDKLDELEKSEPTSYRNAYIMFVGSAVLIVVLFMVGGVGFPAALMIIITDLIVTLVLTRSYSLIGYLPGGSWFYLGPIKMLLGNGAGGPTTEWFMSTSFTYNLVCMPITGGSSPFFASLASYHVANANKVSVKSIFRVQLVTSVLAPIGFVGYVWGMYTFGVTKLLWSLGWSSGMGYLTYTPDALRNVPTYEPWWPHMLAGIVFAIVLNTMHARFVWFPLEPIGFLLATDGHSLIEGIWTMALAAWVIKAITLRVGGSKLYERTGVPAAIGFIIGLVSISIIGGIVLVVRFFHPF